MTDVSMYGDIIFNNTSMFLISTFLNTISWSWNVFFTQEKLVALEFTTLLLSVSYNLVEQTRSC